MDRETRIKKDIVMFEENVIKTEEMDLTDSQLKIIELAGQYYDDSTYYFEKGDFFTAFGCINYAHGLLDAIIKF